MNESLSSRVKLATKPALRYVYDFSEKDLQSLYHSVMQYLTSDTSS